MAMTTVRVRYSRSAYSCAWTKRAFAAVAAVLAMTAQAAEVTGDMALAAAQAWSAENRALSGEIGTPVSVKERRGDDGKLLWYEVAMSGGGCVVAAADTEIEPIVAVADRYDGGIPQGHPLEAMLLADMGRRLSVLEGTPVVRQTPKASGLLSASAARAAEVRASAANASRKWAKLTGRAQDNAKGRLLLKGAAEATTPQTVVRYLPEWASEKLTYWNQFETYTPSNYPAGCVATAGAALLQFYNVTTAPKVTNDCWVDGKKTSLTTIGIDYDWAKLPEEKADYYSFTAEQKDLADRAVYDMGVCLGMSYAPGGSGSIMSSLASVLRNDFGLADARCASIDATVYDKLIYSQIRAGAPVALGIWRPSGAGHAVVAVGYGVDADSTAYTRIFMGWGGLSDAWYALPNVKDYTMVDSIVTMMGATSETMAVCGRVTTESGKGAAYVDVTVGGKTVVTDESGYWGVRVTPVNGSISCSCAGTTKYVSAGANAVKTDLSYKGATLANDLPDEVNFTIPDSEAITIYTNPSDAVRAALREGKILMVLVGFDGCDYCAKLKDDLKGMGTDFAKDFVAFYANTQINAYGLNDETYTGSPYWGTFDPRIWKLEKRWAEDNGRFTISCGYGGSSYTTRLLDSARSQWVARNSAPLSLSVAVADQITMPTTLAAKISFPDGTETAVMDGLSWSVVSGTAATIQTGGLLSPVEGASGNVTIKCEGYFWNTAYSATKTIRIINGVVAKSLVIEGPEIVDLVNVDGAQYVVQAVLSDGSFVEVPVTWETVEAGRTNHTMSATGYLSFRKTSYAEESSVRLTARYGACSASADVTVWGNCVKIHKYTLSDACAWPGKTVTLTIDQVQWWRHGAWEEPTEDFSGVGVRWYYYVGTNYYFGASDTSRTISFTVPPDKNDGAEQLNLYIQTKRANGGSDDLWTYANLQYVSSQPSQLVEVTFDANGGEPALQTRKYAVGHRYYTLPKAERYGYHCDWYTAPSGGTYVSESSDCSAFVTRLYAHWSKKYRYFEYDANGGTGSMSTSYMYYDEPRELRANSFEKPGSMFIGWSLVPDGPVVYQDKEEILNLNDDYKTITLYATWLKGGYRVAFDSNGGAGEMEPQLHTVGACAPLAPATFTRRGATFAGWARSPGGSVVFADGAEVCNLTATVGDTVMLYAVWNLPAVATIDLNGPDAIDLYDAETAQFTAVCRRANGSVVDVAAKWSVEETAVTNAVVSPDGLVSFLNPALYTKASRLKVTAECNGVSASKEVDVWGWYCSLCAWTSPQRVVWPGQALKIVPQAVTWWRHGKTEAPTTDFSGVDFDLEYGWINDAYFSADVTADAGGLSLTVPSGKSDAEGCVEIRFNVTAARFGKSVTKYSWPYFKYLPAAPAQTVNVTFVADGGIPATQTLKYAADFTYGYLPEVVRTGYSYSWYTAPDGGRLVTASSNCLASATRLYARWSPKYYRVTYDANGGTGSMSDSWFYYDRPASLRANAFTKAGAMFAGWATSPDGPVVYQDKEEILNLSSVYVVKTLYAVWSTDFYTVAFDANGGTGSMDSRTCSIGACLTIPDCTFRRTGYAFAGWAETPDGAAKYAAGAQVCDFAASIGATVTLYASWTANTYAVALDQQGGSGGTASVTAAYGSAMPSITVPTRAGYTFGGYYTGTNGSGTLYYTASGVSARTWDRAGAATLYAKWAAVPTYTITFKPGLYGRGSQQTATKEKDVALTLKDAIFTRTGYTQTGWATRDGGAKVSDLEASYTTNAALTLYPFWTANTYAVTLDQQGGSGGTASVTATYGSALPSITVPTRFGYRFGGYYTGTNGSGTQYYTVSGSSARTWDRANAATLYAKWAAVPTYTITYKPGSYGTGEQQTAMKEKNVPLTLKDAIFTRSGYTQTGWATRDGGAKAYNLGASFTTNIALTLYPFWTADTPPDPTPGTNPDPAPGTDPDPAPGADPDPEPGTDPDPTPRTDPDPAPGTDPDPAPGTDPDPTPGTDPVARPELFEESQPISDPAAVFQAATIWDGWLESRGEVLGTIQAKVAKFTARGAPKVTVSVVEGGRKIGGRGQMEIGADGTVSASCALKDGRTVRLAFGPDELSGTLDGAEIRGARTIFTSRQAADKQAAEAVLARLQRTAVVYWGGNALSVVVAKKGKCKVSGNLASGARVSASSQLVVGEAWCAVPVAYAKRGADVRFLLWMNRATGEIAAEGAGEGVEVQWASVPRETLRFRLDGAFDIPGATVLTQFLPAGEGLAFAGGTKWVLPKGGAVKQDRASGEYVDTKPETGNPSGLKLTYSPKTGAFKGSLKVHAVVNGKLKKYSASVAGIMVGDVGYGTATIKKFSSVEISVR